MTALLKRKKPIIINFRFLLTFAGLTILLSSCGFTPVYKKLDEGSTAAKNLATIKVESSHDLLGQFFSSRLSDLLNPDANDVEPKYLLETTLTKNKIPFAIQQDRTITRYKVSIDVVYKISNIVTGEVIDKGSLRRDGGYDKVDSDYASYISDEDTTKRIAKELAEDVRVKMIALLVEGK